jgi:hypothetical protein
MKARIRTVAVVLLLLAAATVTSAKDNKAKVATASAPEVVEDRDVPLQRSWFRDTRPTRECNHGAFGPVCWTLQSIAWRSFNKEHKGIHLSVTVGGSGVRDLSYSVRALVIAVDGNVIELPPIRWGSDAQQDATAEVNDESLIRMIAGAHEVWFTAMATPRISVKLSPRTLESIKAVLDKYDSSDPTNERLGQIDAKLSELTQEVIGLMGRLEKLLADEQNCGRPELGPASEHCVNQVTELTKSFVTKGEAMVALLDERIALANAYPQDAVISEAKKRDTESRRQLLEAIATLKELLADQPR